MFSMSRFTYVLHLWQLTTWSIIIIVEHLNNIAECKRVQPVENRQLNYF